MTFHKIKLASIILFLFIAGCTEKDELTRPVSLNLKISILPPDESYRAEYFYFNWGHIGVQTIGFEGRRVTGDDFFFETNPESNKQFVEFNEQSQIIWGLDVPQGIYNHMTWEIKMKRIDTSGIFDVDIPGQGLVIWAIYEYPDGSDISIFLCIDETELFSFRSRDPDFNTTIALSENKVYAVVLFLDLHYAFLPISRVSIENAQISHDISGQPIIIISRNMNKELYQNLLYRISQSAGAIVY